MHILAPSLSSAAANDLHRDLDRERAVKASSAMRQTEHSGSVCDSACDSAVFLKTTDSETVSQIQTTRLGQRTCVCLL